MSYSEFKPTIWSDKIFSEYDNALVLGGLANREYEGEITDGGSRVKIIECSDVAVRDYTGADITFDADEGAAKFIDIDQEKYAAITIDSVDLVQSKPKAWNERTRKMGVALAETVESYIAGLYTQAGIEIGSTGSVTSITSATALPTLTSIYRQMSENNVPKDGRVAILPPWFVEKITLAKVAKDTDNSSTLANGFVGKFGGFEVYESNMLASSGTDWWAPMFFRARDSIAFVEQLTKTEAGKHEKKFGDYIKSLMVYGAKVVRPSSLAVCYCKAGSES